MSEPGRFEFENGLCYNEFAKYGIKQSRDMIKPNKCILHLHVYVIG